MYAKITGEYTIDSNEARSNATEIRDILMNTYGWSLNSVCAFLGNVGGESGYNPWRWESDNVPTTIEYSSWDPQERLNHGYGLVQWTPANDYIDNATSYEGYSPNFSDSQGNATDGISQINFMVDDIPNQWYVFTDFFPMTYDEYRLGRNNDREFTLRELTGSWLVNYERPYRYDDLEYVNQYLSTRYPLAQTWAEYFGSQPEPVPESGIRHIKPWFYINFIRRK